MRAADVGQTSAASSSASGHEQKADIHKRCLHIRLVPIASRPWLSTVNL